MFISKKEFRALVDKVAGMEEGIRSLHSYVDTVKKQMRCSCDNFEVVENPTITYILTSDSLGISRLKEKKVFEKVCKDCGFTTKYDTEEEAVEDQQALLDRQIDELKEKKKILKKGGK